MPSSRDSGSIPCLVNEKAGTAKAVMAALDGGGLSTDAIDPAHLRDRLRAAVEAGADRVVVAGGDGTVASAARELAGTGIALGVIPAGTLNHFAKDHGIPLDPADAARVALSGAVEPVDLGAVNGEYFLNTSSVGAYVVFVELRDRLQRRFGYAIASVLAFVRVFFSLHSITVRIQAEGAEHLYRTPFVFIGVGERELRVPLLGSRKPGGRRGLHVIVPRTRERWQLVGLAFAAALHGMDAAAARVDLDAYLVDRCRLEMRRPYGNVALDGELVPMRVPLDYRLAHDALRAVVPREDANASA